MAAPISSDHLSPHRQPYAIHRADAPTWLVHLLLAATIGHAVGIREWVRRNERPTLLVIGYLAVVLFALIALKVAR